MKIGKESLKLLAGVAVVGTLVAGDTARAYGTGAPDNVCVINADFNQLTMGREKEQNTGGFVITGDATAYTPGGDDVEITLTNSSIGTDFAGVAIIAVEEGTNTHAGSPAANALVQVRACPGNGSLITHNGGFGDQESVTFMWTPPPTDVGDIAFKAYILKGRRADANNTQIFHRIVEGDGALILTANEVDAGPGVDDAGVDDAGVDDAGVDDAGVDDAGVDDAGVDDAGVDDAGVDDAGVDDAGVDDAGVDDAGVDDAGVDDAGVDDAGVDDAGVDDAGVEEDAGADEDAGTPDVDAGSEPEVDGGDGGEPVGCACDASSSPANGFALALLLFGLRGIRRRRRS